MTSFRKSLLLLALATSSLIPATGLTQQTIEIVNDNAPGIPDDHVWVLFVGNPANVTTGSSGTISGLRNLAIPTGSVSTPQVASGTAVQAALLQNPIFVVPAPPFPLQFISGANAGTQVQVTAYDPTTGTLAVASDPTLTLPMWPLQEQAIGDQFILGAYSQKLSTLSLSGTTPSTLSGQTPNVYTVNAVALDAAVVYISTGLGGQLTYLDSAPSISSSTIPFQTVEVTTGSGGGATTSDLTVIDYFSFPLQIESTSAGSIKDRRTFYFKKSTIETGITKIGATKINNALYLGPGQIASANSGNPSPFPSFRGYLNALTSQPFSIAGSQNFGAPNPTTVYGITVGGNYHSTYGYDTQVISTGTTGFIATMTPQPGKNSFTKAPSYFPSVAHITGMTINLPVATTDNPVGYDAVIYGAVLDANSFSINLQSGSPALTPTTLSGPFAVTSGTSTTQFDSSALATLATSLLGGLHVKFTTGANSGQSAPITSVGTSGLVTLGTPSTVTNTPSQDDQFEILFEVATGTAQNTQSFFGATPLASGALNFLAPFHITFETGDNAGSTRKVVAIDPAGNVRLSADLTEVPQNGDKFSVLVAPSDVFTQLYTNSTFSWAVADLLAALNFGFPGSLTAGNSSAQWYGGFPQQFPFGLARGTPDDGRYNPWAAYFYNASDAYAFAFNDRIAPSPLMSTLSGETFRITVLPENQIDAPLVTATGITSNQINLSWTAEAGVTYSVTTKPSIPPVVTAGTSVTLTGLNPGTPYEIHVKGTKGAQESLVLPLHASTGTSAVMPPTGNVPFGFGFTWAGPNGINLPSQYTVLLNGTPLSLSGNPSQTTSNLAVAGQQGNNLYVLDFQDSTQSNKSVYKAVAEANITDVTPSVMPTSFNLGVPPVMYGSIGALGVAPPTSPYTITFNGNLNSYSSNLVLTIDFNPEQRKAFAPVVTPPPAPRPTRPLRPRGPAGS